MLKKSNSYQKLKDFFHQNWWLTGVSNAIIIILIFIMFNKLSNLEEDYTKKINLAMQNVLMTTPDGKVRVLERELINTDNNIFENIIKNIIKKMTVSESALTSGFNENVIRSITSPQSLIEINEDFKILGKEYFANEQVFNIFLRYWFDELKRGDLPKKLTVLKTRATYTPLQGDKFEMRVEIDLQKDFTDKVSRRVVELLVTDVITVTGYIRPSKYSTVDNGLGIKFDSVKLSIFTYRDYFGKFQQ